MPREDAKLIGPRHLTFVAPLGFIQPVVRILFVTFLTLFTAGMAQGANLVNGIYVIVNDSVITYQEVEEAIAPLVETLAKQYRGQPDVFEQKVTQTRSEKVEELVERQLILHEFSTAGYMLPDTAVDDMIKERIKERFGDRATLTKTLQAQGLTFETFRKQVREDYIVRAMAQQKISSEKIVISPQKIEDFYSANKDKYKVEDQVKLRMIVLNKKPENPGGARKLADEILSKLKEGASFSEMASIYSDSQRNNGGDRGWIDRTFFKSELSDVAFSLKPGKHSDVIDLPEACYLMLVEDAKTSHTKSLTDVLAEIENTLVAEERARLQKQWIARLKAKSFVRYF
jgi:parvulin-like peptidyl-prolyl isomerase